MSQSAVAVRPPMANLAAPSKNSRRLMPPCTYLWKRLSNCGSKSLAFFLSIQLTALGGLSSACRLAQPALKINLSYCAVYNLTERRFVAPFENLTLLGLMMGRRGRERNGGIGYGATIQAGLFAIDSQALPPGATSREECDVGRIR